MTTKLVCFDWDGTLASVPGRYFWTAVETELGIGPKMAEFKEAYFDGKIDYVTWCKKCIDSYMEAGLTKEKLDYILQRKLSLHKGAPGLLKELKSRGIRTAIISGGIRNSYDYAVEKFGISVGYASFAVNFNFDRRSGKMSGGTYQKSDFDGKLEVLRAHCKRERIRLSDVLYVGDSDNDIPVFKACRGIAFSPDSEELKRRAKHIIKSGDLRDVLKYVDN